MSVCAQRGEKEREQSSWHERAGWETSAVLAEEALRSWHTSSPAVSSRGLFPSRTNHSKRKTSQAGKPQPGGGAGTGPARESSVATESPRATAQVSANTNFQSRALQLRQSYRQVLQHLQSSEREHTQSQRGEGRMETKGSNKSLPCCYPRRYN